MKKLETDSVRSLKYPEHKGISEIIAESEARVRKFIEEREKAKALNRRETNREQGSHEI